MKIVTRTEQWKSSILFLTLTVGLAVWLASSGVSLAKPRKDVVYRQCACRCVASGEIVGVITDISNTAGVACELYNNKTCNHDDPSTGGVRSGTTKDCGPFKPGGTVNFKAPLSGFKGPILRRGIEDQQPAEPAPETSAPPE